MDFYYIPPRSQNELMHNGDRYFCLAQQYLSDDKYAAFFQNLSDDAWVTLDNGAGDHDLVTEDALFKVMKELIPNEVIPPDILFDHTKTRQNAIAFYERMVKEELDDKIEVLFCPQGKNQLDWLTSYVWALERDWIKTIGLSKISVPQAFLGVKGDVGIMEARHNCFNYLKVHGLIQKPMHLLGMGDPREFQYYQQFEEGAYIRSSDSCNSIWSAINQLDWTEEKFERVPTPKDYFDRDELTDKQRTVFENNVDFLKESVV
jgi:hypothetical protein